jgi:integrase
VSARRGERILGPYAERGGFRVIEVDAAGKRVTTLFESEAKAERYIEILRADLAREEQTTHGALDAYKVHLAEKGDRAPSIATTEWTIRKFFPSAQPLSLLSAKACQKRYDELRTTPKKDGKPLATDTHRNILAQAKSFLAWCVEKGWMRENPLDAVKGIGKRRHRGKSLGKDGRTLRIKEARAFFAKALDLSDGGDQGATATLTGLLLGMRASEIISRRVEDLDEDGAPGDLLWIPCAKTPAGRRTLEVPEALRPHLLACTEGKAPTAYLFEAEAGGAHWRDWIRKNTRRICRLAGVPEITAHALRGLLATITAERGMAGHLIAATLGHEEERTTFDSYAAPGAASAGANRRGLVLLNGGAAK